MEALANEFELEVRGATTRTTRAVTDDGGIAVLVFGRDGQAEMGFYNDGSIIGYVDGEHIHGWNACPTVQEMRESAKKVRELIG